jgi:hypothetical protein
MNIELGFAISTAIDEYPIVRITFNNSIVADNLVLNQCCNIDNKFGKLQFYNFDVNVNDDEINHHVIKVQGLNILDKNKINGDFGFQIRAVKINNVILDQFVKPGITYNTINNFDYITHFMIPNNLLHELESVKGELMHVKRGHYANYINSANGWFELDFETPLYNWIARANYGKLAKWFAGCDTH